MQCEFIKSDGEQCKSYAMNDEKNCFRHSKHVSDEEKMLTSQKGGQNRALVNQNPLPPISLENPNHIVLLLADTINRVRSGELGIRTANCIGYLSGHLTKALELSEVQEKLDRIEKLLSKNH